MGLEAVQAKVKELQDKDKAERETRDEAELTKLLEEHPEYFTPSAYVVEAFPLLRANLPGHVVMRMPTPPEQQELRETLIGGGAQAKGKALGQVARRCREYPDEKTFGEMLKANPGIIDQCASSLLTASDGKEKEAKKG